MAPQIDSLFQRISMIRSPALRQDSTIGQNCSKAAIKAEVLQFA